jgi:aryl-alcohol dehydrogenase-like predicted oxidoreductase
MVVELMSRWNITPLCGSTSPDHVQEALAVQGVNSLSNEDPDVQALWDAMRRAGRGDR